MIGLVVFGIVATVVVVMAARTIKIVPAAHVAIVERFGRYHRTVGPGIVFIVPVVEKTLPYTDLRDQAVSYEREPAITKDNYVIEVSMIVYRRIVDARAAEYEVENLDAAMEKAVRTGLRDIVGDLQLDQIPRVEEELNAKLRLTLDDVARKWGVSVLRVEIREMIVPD